MGHSCPIFKCLLVFQSAMQHSLLVLLPNCVCGGFVSLKLGPAHPNWSKFEIWGWSGLVWGLYLSHPHQSSFRVLPRGAHHCLMLKNFRLGSATVKPMYLELLGDIVSIAHILFLNLFVFCCFSDFCNSIQYWRQAILQSPLDRWRALHYQGIFPHSNCSPLFIGSLVKIAEGK